MKDFLRQVNIFFYNLRIYGELSTVIIHHYLLQWNIITTLMYDKIPTTTTNIMFIK